MQIGTMRAEEARVFDSESGNFQRPDGKWVEIFWHNGGHMIEADEDDDMPLDDWRDPERPGWYYRFIIESDQAYGPFTKSRIASEQALAHGVN